MEFYIHHTTEEKIERGVLGSELDINIGGMEENCRSIKLEKMRRQDYRSYSDVIKTGGGNKI